MEDLKVYTTPTCPWCTKLKDYLNDKGVAFQEVDVTADYGAAMKMVDITGQRSVPVITKGEQFVVGFNQEQIDQLLQ